MNDVKLKLSYRNGSLTMKIHEILEQFKVHQRNIIYTFISLKKCSSFTIIFSESHPNSIDEPKTKSSIEHPIKYFICGQLEVHLDKPQGEKWTSQIGTVALAMWS